MTRHHVILSQEVEDEYREVLLRPKFDRFVSIERRRLILDIVIMAAAQVEPTEIVRECQVQKDDKYLALAAAGTADDHRQRRRPPTFAAASNGAYYPSGSPCIGTLPNPVMIAVTSSITACAAAASVPFATIATPLPLGR